MAAAIASAADLMPQLAHNLRLLDALSAAGARSRVAGVRGRLVRRVTELVIRKLVAVARQLIGAKLTAARRVSVGIACGVGRRIGGYVTQRASVVVVHLRTPRRRIVVMKLLLLLLLLVMLMLLLVLVNRHCVLEWRRICAN